MTKPLKLAVLAKVLPPSVDAHGLPRVPGLYHWHDAGWDSKVTVAVYKKRGERWLFVKPPIPNGIPVRISPRIAGRFTVAKEQKHAV